MRIVVVRRELSWLCALAGALGCGSSSKASGEQASAPPSPDGSVEASAGGDAGVSGCGSNTLQSGTFNLTHAGTNYSYIVHLPPGYDGKKETPLVLNWHGYTSNASQQEAFSNMDPVADSKGFIVVYPNSPDQSWNAGTCCAFSAMTRDDVGFALDLVAQIQKDGCIDPKRIYTTGMSNGAFMTYRLGCEHADLFAAIAPVAGKVGIPKCTPSRSVPVLAFHGTSDPLVSYDAGTLSGENLTVPDTVKAWATRDGCTQGPDQTYQMGTVTCQTWSSCNGGATVTLCTAQGEGHCWPGQATCPYGNSTTDIDATSKIAAFFSMFSLP